MNSNGRGGRIGSEDEQSALIGRSHELGVLRELLAGIHEHGETIVLRGASGVGKTALLDVMASEAAALGLRVLRAAGVEAEQTFPYAALHRLLHPLLRGGIDVPTRSVQTLREAVDHASPDGPPDVFAVAMAALTVLTVAADALPVVLVIDDLQWVDAPSADVVAFVMRRIHDDPIVTLAACRPDALRYGEAHELELPPLAPADARALLERDARALSSVSQREILDLADGNPLALVELARSITTGSHGPLRADRTIPLTSRLIDAFAQRTVGLDDTARAVLLASALAPGATRDEIVRAAADAVGAAPSHKALDESVDAGLLIDDDAHVSFRHPLARAAIITTSTRAQRRTMHHNLAAVITDPERNLWHRAQAAVGPDHDLAAELDDLAGRRSGPLVIDILVRAAELTADTDLRAHRLIRAGEIATEVADWDRATQLATTAAALVPTGADQRRLRALRIAGSDSVPHDIRPSLELVSLARESLAEGDVEAAVQLLDQVAARTRAARLPASIEDQVTELALELPLDQHDLRVTSIIAHISPLRHSTTIIERLADIVPDALAADQDHYLAYSAMAIGDMPLAAASFSRAIARERESGELRRLAVDLAMRGWVAMELGDWGTAAQVATEGLALAHETGQYILVCPARLLLATIAGGSGNDETAIGHVLEASRIITTHGIANYRLAVNLAQGIAAALTGRYRDAVDFLDPLLDPTHPDQNPRHALPSIPYYVIAATRLGRTEHARLQLRRFERQIAGSTGPGVHINLGIARPALAPDESVDALYRATLADPMMQRPFDQARLLLAHGGWLRRHGRIVESREPLRAARQIFDQLGNVPFSARARAELRGAGEQSRNDTITTTWDALTPQEAQIATLAADGLTNRQIGERLFLSNRTVGSHLYRIFPKLGITTRGQLAGTRSPANSD